jgi:hypothetical protein
MLLYKQELEYTKGVIRIRKSKTNRQHNEELQKDKQRSTKHIKLKIEYNEPPKNRGWTQVVRKIKQFLLH